MAEFSFGQVEATLAAINGIADHKRVAFAGRLKFLQKNGLLDRDRSKPGRGKAGTYSFAQTMQLALGVELLRFGLTPQRTAQLVSRNWTALLYSVFLATYSEGEVGDRASGGVPPVPIDWIWLVKTDALTELLSEAASDFDPYEAIEAIKLQDLEAWLGEVGFLSDPAGRRCMVIYGTALTRAVVTQIATVSRFESVSAIRAEIEQDLHALGALIEDIDSFLSRSPQLTPSQRAELLRNMNEKNDPRFAPNALLSPAELEERAHEMIEILSPAAVKVLADVFGALRSDREEALKNTPELLFRGALRLEEHPAGPCLALTGLGKHGAALAAEKVGGANVDSEA